MKEEVSTFLECCELDGFTDPECSSCITSKQIDEYFFINEFDSINILSTTLGVSNECNCADTTASFARNSSSVEVLIENTLIDINERIDRISEIYDDAEIIFTQNNSYCEDGLSTLGQAYQSADKVIWIHVGDDYIFHKSKGIGDSWEIGTCSYEYRDKLQCVIDNFIDKQSNIFTEILNIYEESGMTLVINVDCPPGDTTAQGQTIDEFMGRLGIVDIYINSTQFDLADDYPLRVPATLLHEGCHALTSIKIFKAGGPSNCSWLNYSYYFASYGNVGQTDECIIAINLIDKQADLLLKYNDSYLDRKNYLAPVWGPYFYQYSGCNTNINYTLSQISDWYIEMRDSDPNGFPCLEIE